MRRYVTLRDFYSNKSGQHCARAWVSTTILRPTCARANVISITNKLNTAPRAGCRRAEHRTLLATCVKLKGGRTAGTQGRARARRNGGEFMRTHQVYSTSSLLIFRVTCSDTYILITPYSLLVNYFLALLFCFSYLYPSIYWYMIFSHTQISFLLSIYFSWIICDSEDSSNLFINAVRSELQISNDKTFNVMNLLIVNLYIDDLYINL